MKKILKRNLLSCLSRNVNLLITQGARKLLHCIRGSFHSSLNEVRHVSPPTRTHRITVIIIMYAENKLMAAPICSQPLNDGHQNSKKRCSHLVFALYGNMGIKFVCSEFAYCTDFQLINNKKKWIYFAGEVEKMKCLLLFLK